MHIGKTASPRNAFVIWRKTEHTLHYGKAMRADDAQEFKKAMQNEANAHTSRGHWVFMKKEDVPANYSVLPSIWAFKRKRRIMTGEVYKHKVCLNIHGRKQTYGENYWQTYSPVVNWFSIRLVLILSIILSWHTRQIDFVLAFP